MKHTFLVLLAALIALYLPGSTLAQTTSLSSTFTYQGNLSNSSGAVNSPCDFQFSLFDAAASGTQIGSTLNRLNTAVTNGVFSVQLDFGGTAFDGTDRYLSIALRCPAGSGGYTTLTPRQSLTPTPYALGLYGLAVEQNATSPNLIGGFKANNASDNVVGAFIGGGGDVNGFNIVSDNYGVVGGGRSNTAGDVFGDTNTADYATVGGGFGNESFGGYGVIGGGAANRVGGHYSTVAGGYFNLITAEFAFIGGGAPTDIASNPFTTNNVVSDNYGVIGGGGNNKAGNNTGTITDAQFATIGGGEGNIATSDHTTIGGGQNNQTTDSFATVAGGQSNAAIEFGATVGGGSLNAATGTFSTVPGGQNNVADGSYSFAAGNDAKANHDGSFVWGDSNLFQISSNGLNTFTARSTGGARFISAIDGSGNPTAGVTLPSGGGAWSSLSDQNAKDNFTPIDPQAVLQGVVNLPLSTWNYNSQDTSIRHIGPMAQDFYTNFNVGEDDTHISTIDADGVALAAIQGLYQQVQNKDAQITDLQNRLNALETRLTALENSSAPVETRVFQPWMLMGALAIGGVWVGRRKPFGTKWL